MTGTPIQNSMEELFALLNFIDPAEFEDCDEFLEKFGNIKSKERIDDLHDKIRPYILRRLKEDGAIDGDKLLDHYFNVLEEIERIIVQQRLVTLPDRDEVYMTLRYTF